MISICISGFLAPRNNIRASISSSEVNEPYIFPPTITFISSVRLMQLDRVIYAAFAAWLHTVVNQKQDFSFTFFLCVK